MCTKGARANDAAQIDNVTGSNKLLTQSTHVTMFIGEGDN